MIPAATAHALRSPPFEPSAFTPTKFSTTEDKAWFGNALLKFLANDSPQTGFTTRLYHRLSLTFGHIAHFNKYGFYGTFFQDNSGNSNSCVKPFNGRSSAILTTHSAMSNAPSLLALKHPASSIFTRCA